VCYTHSDVWKRVGGDMDSERMTFEEELSTSVRKIQKKEPWELAKSLGSQKRRKLEGGKLQGKGDNKTTGWSRLKNENQPLTQKKKTSVWCAPQHPTQSSGNWPQSN